jgi:hypothetical protein
LNANGWNMKTRELIEQMRNLIQEAIDVHIYGDDEKPDPECQYHQALKDADKWLKENT